MNEKKFIITESQLEEIDHYLKNRSYVAARALLRQLPILEEKQEKKNVPTKSN